MEENNVIGIAPVEEQTKKQPWYKRVWNGIKKIGSKFIDWIEDWWDLIKPILLVVYGLTIGLIWGWIFGLMDKDNNKANYDAGYKKGFSNGYTECTKDLKGAGYMVYGGYGPDSDKVIVTKIDEVPVEKQD